MAAPRKTRKIQKGGRVLDVKKEKDIHLFEKAIVKGPLTLVYVNAKWCGACHKFSEEVWSPLTKLKNKQVNIASIDSEMIGKTSLANVPRKFYPTLMLVGKDKKPATFKDETGEPTNAMPRGNSLLEDKAMLMTLAKTKQPTAEQLKSVNVSMPRATPIPMNDEDAEDAEGAEGSNFMSLSKQSIHANSMPRAQITPNIAINTVGKSPFEASNANETIQAKPNTPRGNFKIKTLTGSAIKATVSPPNVGADVGTTLVASQSRATTASAGLLAKTQGIVKHEGGGLLRAIRNKTASIKAFLRNSKRSRKDRKQ